MRTWVCVAMLAVSMDATAQGDDYTVDFRPNMVAVDWAGVPLLRYKYDKVPYKPYVIEFFTPAGVTPLMDGPEDHKHHHALMFAVKVDGVNFWEEFETPGREKHLGFEKVGSEGVDGVDRFHLTELLEWQDSTNDAALLRESRTITLYRATSLDHSVMTWQARFSPPEGKQRAELTGAHYHGLGVRFHDSMVHEGVYTNAADAEGEVVRGSEKLTRANWCAYQARAEGAPVTWAMFAHPENPRHPAWWFTMHDPFAYMSATLNLHREPLEVLEETPLTLTYGIALWDGQVSREQIEAAYQQWLELQKSR